MKNLIPALICLFLGIPCQAGIIYVDDDADVGGDGQTWGTAYRYLQDALYAAQDGNDIWVAEGTYKPDEDEGGNVTAGEREETFQLINGVVIYGGFPSGGGEWEGRDPNAYKTILSGDIGTPDVNTDNSYHMVTGSGTDQTAVLDGFTITGGNANGSNERSRGGGFYNYYGSPMVTNCTFRSNSADAAGSGMYNEDSSPTVTNCIFKGNASNWHGGGMYNTYGSNATLTNCIFSRNSTTYHGGGIYNYWQSSATLTNCTFTENLAGFGGGGMMNIDDSSPKLTNCVFGGNSATIHGGGGVENWNNSSPTLTNCTFTGNSAEWGGGMYNWDNSNPTVTNCIFTGNLAESGGGMENNMSSATLTNCTFTENLAEFGGGGMMNIDDSNPKLTNCILWGDTPEEIYPYGAYWEITYSDVQGGWRGLGNIDADPCFVDPCNGDYHLKSEGWRWDPNLYRSSDFTQDGIVNFKDFANLAGFWLFEASNLPVDLNRDGAVNLEDLSIFSKKFLTSGSTGGWTFDSVTSRCIDAGNPGSPLGDELISVPDDPCNIWGENIRINMGAYGGTAEASMPPYGWALLADLTNDGTVNFEDFAGQASDWQKSESEQPGDLNRNGTVDIADLALLTEDWLGQTSWF